MTDSLSGLCMLRDDHETWRARPARFGMADGRIASVEPETAAQPDNSLILPALSNAHDHGRGLRTIAFGAGDDALEVWIASLGLEPATDPYLRAGVAFARLAESGVAALNHCHGSSDPRRTVDEARAVARAVRDVGVRVAFAVPISGRNPWTYGAPEPFFDRLPSDLTARMRASESTWMTGEEQLAQVDEIADLEDDLFSVQYGPIAPQWVDDAILERIAQGSADTGRRVHMHLFETRFQREWADVAYPGGLVRHLDSIGLLSERLTVAHGVHLDEDDCALLAERGVFVSLNTSSNLRLKSGLAPANTFLAAGLRFGLGLDCLSFDDDEDALRELRVAWRLQRGWGTAETLDRDRLLDAALVHGRQSILGEGETGTLTEGAPADVLVLDRGRIESDVLEGCADPIDLMIARARKEDVRSLYVAGRAVVERGQTTGFDRPAAEAELLNQARAAGAPPPDDDLHEMRRALAEYYQCGCHRRLG